MGRARPPGRAPSPLRPAYRFPNRLYIARNPTAHVVPFGAPLMTLTVCVRRRKTSSGSAPCPRVLAATSILGCIFLGINGFFTPETNHYLLMFALFVGGLTRSFFFTGVNTFGYADVSEAEASQATSIYAVAQQISVALGVAVAGGILEASSQLRGAPLDLQDFHVAWFTVAALAAISAIQFLRLPPDAGSNVSGHRIKPLAKDEVIA